MYDHYFRVDRRTGIDAIRDGVLRMRCWDATMRNRPILDPILAGLQPGTRLFRMCWFKTWASMWANATFVDDPAEFVITRIHRNQIHVDGNRVGDDNELLGHAVLAYRIEPDTPGNVGWSTWGIPRSATEMLGPWTRPVAPAAMTAST